MGYKTIEVKLRTDYTDEELRYKISKLLRINDFTYQIEKQSLDGRNVEFIHWVMRIMVNSPELPEGEMPHVEQIEIPRIKTHKKVLVVGSGPAGFFAAQTLLESGFDVTLIEQGPDVYQRTNDVKQFEKNGELNERSNYSYGEGGAGTFSDGKLTSRTKAITLEKNYIFDTYVKAGAPEEIRYLSKPHVGSNVLTKIVKNLRESFIAQGGKWHFNSKMIDFAQAGNKIKSIETEQGIIEADYFIFAIGHSAYDTYSKLITNGVKFQIKSFAIGTRVEHPQELINRAKWRVPKLPGVKAAEYSLVYNATESISVYSFCMCPGGMVVPAATNHGINIVNGMSNYKRNYKFANSAIVSGFNLNDYYRRDVDPLEALDWVTKLERKFYDFTGSYKAPSVKIVDFMRFKPTTSFPESSYPFDLVTSDFREMFPRQVYTYMTKAVRDFARKLRGFEDGVMLGLESKTSSPIQVVRDGFKCAGIDNLYIAGEGSGFAGGIVSSGADGIRCAMDIIKSEA